MRDVALSALRQLDLDYAITSISGGAGQDYEIVMWDRCQWQPKTAHFGQLKTAHFGERAGV